MSHEWTLHSKDATVFQVNIDAESGLISVYNNGGGIPVEMHADEKCWVQPPHTLKHYILNSWHTLFHKRPSPRQVAPLIVGHLPTSSWDSWPVVAITCVLSGPDASRGIRTGPTKRLSDKERSARQVPELIFGHLLTSSNYNDSEKKTTGGRNGYGAKLANIFSIEFTVPLSSHLEHNNTIKP